MGQKRRIRSNHFGNVKQNWSQKKLFKKKKNSKKKKGGIWNYDENDNSVYESLVTNTFRENTSFKDLEISKEFPNYPSHRQIMHYLREFAQKFDLERNILFNHTVTNVKIVSQIKFL